MGNLIFNLRIGKIHFQLDDKYKFTISKNNYHSWFKLPIIKLY